MKRELCALCLVFSLLCACNGGGERPEEAPVPASPPTETGTPLAAASDAEEVIQAVLDSQPDREGLTLLAEEDLEFYLTEIYGLEPGIWTSAAVYTASGVDGREAAVLRLAHSTYDAAPAVEALEEYRQNRLADFCGYAPEQAALLEKARVVSGWSCVALLVCEDMEAARTAFETAAGEAAVYTPAPGESGAPVGLTPEETRWFIPFDPPGEYDMSLYDTSAVRAAYASGDGSGLTEKDAAILARCREVLAECVTEDMTDFEKELALHDWLVEWGKYDETVLETRTPPGLPDNTNPYGMLVGGYGICLGYAATFQLLMDLAGVECITVVGASRENREDHAWNMVKLEGEWYCVDPTWDDPVGNEDFEEEYRILFQHGYFNVTSQEMRSTDHQWDYQNVPEATADRFYWDARGPLPS